MSLEDPDVRSHALQDPRGFLSAYPKGVVLDEAQHTPEIFSYLQTRVDAASKMGRYVLTGSQNFMLGATISQSLSGRVGLSTLLPMSMSELPMANKTLDWLVFSGGYPGIYKRRMRPTEFYPSYIQSYLERDVRGLKKIGNLTQFQIFLKLCAGRVGQVLNFSSFAQDCGISHSTAREWLTLLEASYIVFRLPSFHRNFNKRLIKMPKLYFYDTGLVCALLSLEKESQLVTHPLRGALMENAAVVELLKYRVNQGLPPNLFFWRDQAGHEIDVIAEWGGELKTFEVKSSQTFSPDFAHALNYFSSLDPTHQGHVVFNTTREGQYQNFRLLPIKRLSSFL